MDKRVYTKPVIERISLDNSISLVMMTPGPGTPRNPYGPSGTDKNSQPMASPFGDRPFSG